MTYVAVLDIPLLLSRLSMKITGDKIHLENDTAIRMRKEIALNITSSMHYYIPIDKTEIVQTILVNG